MGTNHKHNHKKIRSNIAVAFFLNAFFVVVEILGGFLTNSIAILTDALHDFGDCLSLAAAWALQKKSEGKRDKKYSYGYKRFSLLGSIFLSGVLSVSSILVLIESIERLGNPQDVNVQGMLWIAVFGIIINGLSALRIKSGASLNERTVYLHIMEDVLGWVGILLVSLVMNFVYLPMLDSLFSIGISIWIIYNVYKTLRSVSRVVLQGIPEDINIEELTARITEIEGIQSVHDLHLWSLDGEAHVMTLHVISDDRDNQNLKRMILSVAGEYNIVHTTIEFEKKGSVCETNCDAVPPAKS